MPRIHCHRLAGDAINCHPLPVLLKKEFDDRSGLLSLVERPLIGEHGFACDLLHVQRAQVGMSGLQAGWGPVDLA